MNKDDERWIEHEVRLRVQGRINEKNETKFESMQSDFNRIFDKLDSKIDSHFKWTIGIMITLFGSLILTKFI